MLDNLWSLIVESNLFNFAALIILFVYIGKKLNFSEKLEIFKKDIILNLQLSSRKRKSAYEKLSGAKLKAQNIDSEISERITQITNQTSGVIDSINEATEKNIKKMENDINVYRENEINNTVTEISARTIASALDIAKENVEKKFENNRKLQEEYIDKSLEMLERLDISVHE